MSINNPYPEKIIDVAQHGRKYPNEKYGVFNEGVKAAVLWMEGECDNNKHSGGYWEGGGLDCNRSPIKGIFHYDKRANCDDCMSEIKKAFGM
jgi:hypothetical protein